MCLITNIKIFLYSNLRKSTLKSSLHHVKKLLSALLQVQLLAKQHKHKTTYYKRNWTVVFFRGGDQMWRLQLSGADVDKQRAMETDAEALLSTAAQIRVRLRNFYLFMWDDVGDYSLSSQDYTRGINPPLVLMYHHLYWANPWTLILYTFIYMPTGSELFSIKPEKLRNS